MLSMEIETQNLRRDGERDRFLIAGSDRPLLSRADEACAEARRLIAQSLALRAALAARK